MCVCVCTCEPVFVYVFMNPIVSVFTQGIENLEDWEVARVLPVPVVNQIGLQLRRVVFNEGLIGELPSSIGDLKQLQFLNLDSCNISGPIPASIGDLAQLRTLELHCTNISGPIPPSIGDLTELRTLDLHDTNVSGEIPPSMGGLKHLSYLNLSDTDLLVPESVTEVEEYVGRKDVSWFLTLLK